MGLNFSSLPTYLYFFKMASALPLMCFPNTSLHPTELGHRLSPVAIVIYSRPNQAGCATAFQRFSLGNAVYLIRDLDHFKNYSCPIVRSDCTYNLVSGHGRDLFTRVDIRICVVCGVRI